MCRAEFEDFFRLDRKSVESLPHSDPRRQFFDDIFVRFCSFLSSHSLLLPGDVVSFTCADTVDDPAGKHVYFSFHVDLRQYP